MKEAWYRLATDWPKAILAGAYFFLVLLSYYLLKPLRDSNFLTSFHPHAKPLFNIITMVLLFGAASGYSYLVKKIQGWKFICIFYSTLIINLFIFRILFIYYPGFASAIFYTWLSIINVFMVTMFWTQVNELFADVHDRVFYIIIGLSGAIGAALGGKITGLVTPLVGTDNLIFLAIGVICFVFIVSIIANNYSDRYKGFSLPSSDFRRTNLKGLLNEKYAVCLLVLVAVGTFVHSIYDYQLSVLVANTIEKNKDAYSIFYGNLYFRLNTFAFVSQIFIAPAILFSIGPARGLYLFIALIIGTGILAIQNSLFIMEWAFIIFVGAGYSTVQIFREQLYGPASQFIKVSCKGFIDTFGFRMGDTLAAISFVIVSLLNSDLSHLDYLVFVSSIIAAYYLFQANKIYLVLLELNSSGRKSSHE